MNLFKKIALTIRVIKNLHLFGLDFFGFLKDKEIQYKLRSGLEFIARGSSTDAAEIIVVVGDMEYPKMFFPDKENPIILDAGSNIGSFSLYVYHVLADKNPLIYSLEPSLENFEILRKNIAANKAERNIKAFSMALGGKDGQGFLDVGKDFDAFHVVENSQISGDSKIQEIELATLDTFCKKQEISQIDLLKMDIEGGEYEVFQSSIGFIRNNVRSIFIEIHNLDEKNNIENFKKFAVDNNFEIVSEISQNVLFLRNRNNK